MWDLHRLMSQTGSKPRITRIKERMLNCSSDDSRIQREQSQGSFHLSLYPEIAGEHVTLSRIYLSAGSTEDKQPICGVLVLLPKAASSGRLEKADVG